MLQTEPIGRDICVSIFQNPPANLAVERMAAGGTCLQIRALVARRHRSPLRSVETL
jgi:hypothetical protein